MTKLMMLLKTPFSGLSIYCNVRSVCWWQNFLCDEIFMIDERFMVDDKSHTGFMIDERWDERWKIVRMIVIYCKNDQDFPWNFP